jgi:hypothetical protein
MVVLVVSIKKSSLGILAASAEGTKLYYSLQSIFFVVNMDAFRHIF